MRGPIDYIIVGFEGNKFDGSILSAIASAIDSGAVALVALSVISKDAEGKVTTLDVDGAGDAVVAEFAKKYPGDDSLVTGDDVDEMAELIENNCTAGMLIVEQLWAKPLKQALINANGVLVAEGRIHPEAAAELDNTNEEN